MTGDEVRRRFLDFFRRRGHETVKSSSLVPAGDATLLFANAGMNQFKDLFLGRETRPYKRAASSQKCLRVSGKHNDFEQVGRTARHHTFFEMLGNFSFGDYFKKDAIAFAWELVTKDFGIPADRLWVSVFREDDEAAEFWRDVGKLPRDRIARLGEKENFWSMGDTGPCGPCSEIYFDQGPGVGCGRPECAIGCACDRYLEFWNLVFMQFDRQPDGTMQPLAAPSIDTGAGLERMASILQGVDSNYRTDLFIPLIDGIAGRARIEYGQEAATDVSLQVIADHLRALVFLIADGIVPSNEKRGYVLRRIIRRALTHGLNLDLHPPFLFDLTARVIETMAGAYPELERQRSRIADLCKREEEAFRDSLARGMEAAQIVFARYKGGTVPASESVKLWTTYGVTLEIQQALAQSRDITLAEKPALETEMEKHREAARASWKGGQTPSYPAEMLSLPNSKEWKRTRFEGYESLLVSDARVLLLAGEDGPLETLGEGEQGFVVLDRTPFYAEAGGQVGDTGQLRTSDGSEAEVDDTQSPVPGLVVHLVTVLNGSLQQDGLVEAAVDPRARAATMRNHTATHLLHAALKRVLGEEVQQAGSYVGPDRLRFDFNYPKPVGAEALNRIEDEVNEQVLLNTPVAKQRKSFDEAMAGGAVALFGEKYGDTVRVVTIPGYSQELCGGTHCNGTGDIGSLRIVSERGIAAGVRRIEALTGLEAVRKSREESTILSAVEEILRTPRDGIQEALVNVLAGQKAKSRELERLRLKVAQLEVGSPAAPVSGGPAIERIGGVALIVRRVEGLDRPALRTLSDNLKREAGASVVILASEFEGKVAVLAAVTADLTDRLDARVLIKELAAVVGGGGGGNARLAEAGGRAPEKIPELLARSREIVARHLASATSPRK